MADHIVGQEVLANNIVVFTKGFLREVNKSMERVRDVLDKKITRNISHTDHSLKDLALMGHPYAKRAPQKIHDPDYIIHKQSGKLVDGKYSGVESASISGGQLTANAYVGIRESVEHAPHVIFGTSKMVPRDFLTGSLNEIKDECFDIIRIALNGAIINFRGKEVKA